ncbi:P-loop containing nucleoside triphosphate hydrolase protein [Thozetella sp. PMI_491]|nr:P-loop containing nucleoside triphosphate hydrolase protein [Thozetella sp. PMI_491]
MHSAPMAFFTTTDARVTTNRFSQDMTLVDMELPTAAINSLVIYTSCLAQLVLLSVITRYFAIAGPFCAAVMFAIQRAYLRTSRQLRLLDLEAKSPLYSHFHENPYRPFCDPRIEMAELLVLDMTVAGIAVLTVGLAAALQGMVKPGVVGVALVNVMMFSISINLLISSWTSLETSLGAILRIKTFEEDTVSEDLTGEDAKVPMDWPTQGALTFDHVTASYGDEPILALDNLSLSIKLGEKIGICGSSGSGKSTLALALFRMIELSEGTIYVDGQDIKTVPRNIDQFHFNSSVRLNIDPLKRHSDAAILAAFSNVQLEDTIVKKGGIDVLVDEIQLSHGQKQLLSLARALLQSGRIIVLDEVTSSYVVDHETEKTAVDVIRSHFEGRTVMAIAHRLNTILEFDRIAVFDGGKLIELNTPAALLSRDGTFRT